MRTIEVKTEMSYHGIIQDGMVLGFLIEVEVAGRTIDITDKLTVDQLNEAKDEYLELYEQEGAERLMEEAEVKVKMAMENQNV